VIVIKEKKKSVNPSPATGKWLAYFNHPVPDKGPDLHLIKTLEHGVSPEVIQKVVASTSLPKVKVAKFLNLTPRALERRKRISPGETERLLRLTSIYYRAQSILGGLKAAQNWMEASNMALGDNRPEDLLNTGLDAGISLVERELTAIEHGIFT
jgi:putative toxin-antitoxin system antitoxin component (TIGR02293 family)